MEPHETHNHTKRSYPGPIYPESPLVYLRHALQLPRRKAAARRLEDAAHPPLPVHRHRHAALHVTDICVFDCFIDCLCDWLCVCVCSSL